MDDDCDFEGSLHYKDGFLVRADSVGAPDAPADRAELAGLSEPERERLRYQLGQERAVSAHESAAREDVIERRRSGFGGIPAPPGGPASRQPISACGPSG